MISPPMSRTDVIRFAPPLEGIVETRCIKSAQCIHSGEQTLWSDD